MIDNIMQWLRTCEYLKPFMNTEKALIRLEHDENITTSYVVEVTPANPIVKSFIDGSKIRQQTIELKCFTDKLDQEVENQLHLEDIVKWIDEQNDDLPNGFWAVEALTNGYVYEQDQNENKAIYVISINVQYFSEV